MKKLYLVDAYALIFKYYYAFLGRPMRNSSGMNTSIIYGFTKFMRDLVLREKPDAVGVAFDPKGGSFRREIYPEYKANRSQTPEDIIESVPYIKRVLEAMHIPVLEVAGFEADDTIGTLSVKGEAAGYEVFMVTPDKDYAQLVTEKCKIYKHKDNSAEIVGIEQVNERFGIENPRQVIDILAVWGDASDNVPGVNGIGEKGAMKLVREWGSVEEIIANTDKIKGKQSEYIVRDTEQLKLSKALVTISLDVPIELDEKALALCSPDNEKLHEIFAQADIRTFRGGLYTVHEDGAISAVEEVAQNMQRGGGSRVLPTTVAEYSAIKRKAEKIAAQMAGQGSLFGDEEVAVTPVITKIQTAVSEVVTTTNTSNLQTIRDIDHNYTVADDEQTIDELVKSLAACDEFCFDTETTGLDYFRDKIIGISFAIKEFEAFYIPLNEENRRERIEKLRPLFESEEITKIGQNLKFDISMLRNAGVEVRGKLLDTMLLHYLLDSESRNNMDYLAGRYLNYSPISIESIIGKGARQLTMDRVSVEVVAEYAAEDADVALRLKNTILPLVKEQGLWELYQTVEEPLITTLVDIEMEGVTLNCEALNSYAKELRETLITLESEIREMANCPTLNVNSPAQLGEVLFGQLKIAAKPKKTKTGKYSTDEEYLQGFAKSHPIVGKIFEYRGVKKLLSTYVESLPQLINPVTGRVHTSYNQAITSTGRLSSTNPNLQNIPIRDALGKPIRAAFIPSSEEHKILSADYSQVELRVMAHLSCDTAMIAAFQEGADIHSATAARIYNKSIEEVTDEERRRAKTANFGIIYGISAFGLSQRLDIPNKEASEIIDGYFRSYPQVREFMQSAIESAKEQGYVETMFGRRRAMRDINSGNALVRKNAERNAINAPIQGSAADIMKLAMIGIHKRLKREGLQSRMIMQVHDEVVVNLLKSEEEAVRKLIVEEMEGAAELSVKLLTECGVGTSWLAAH